MLAGEKRASQGDEDGKREGFERADHREPPFRDDPVGEMVDAIFPAAELLDTSVPAEELVDASLSLRASGWAR